MVLSRLARYVGECDFYQPAYYTLCAVRERIKSAVTNIMEEQRCYITCPTYVTDNYMRKGILKDLADVVNLARHKFHSVYGRLLFLIVFIWWKFHVVHHGILLGVIQW